MPRNPHSHFLFKSSIFICKNEYKNAKTSTITGIVVMKTKMLATIPNTAIGFHKIAKNFVASGHALQQIQMPVAQTKMRKDIAIGREFQEIVLSNGLQMIALNFVKNARKGIQTYLVYKCILCTIFKILCKIAKSV